MKIGPEHSLQILCMDYFRRALPRPCVIWFCPNGVALSRAWRFLAMRLGLLAGVHDVHLIWPGGFGTLEFKNPNGKASMTAGQEVFATDMMDCGHHWAEVTSLEQARAVVASWLATAGLQLNPRIHL